MRSKFGSFKEYHTSLDDLTFVSESSLDESFSFLVQLVDLLESNVIYKQLIYASLCYASTIYIMTFHIT